MYDLERDVCPAYCYDGIILGYTGCAEISLHIYVYMRAGLNLSISPQQEHHTLEYYGLYPCIY